MSELAETRKIQTLQELVCSPVPWERKGEGETPLTFSRGIPVMPPLCQVQICLLWECCWIGNIQPQGICAQQGTGSQMEVSGVWFLGSKGNEEPFSPPPAPDAQRQLFPLSHFCFTFALIKENGLTSLLACGRNLWGRCMNSQSSWGGVMAPFARNYVLKFFWATLAPQPRDLIICKH